MTNSFFPFSRFTVFGDSMLPTLKPGQDILVFTWAYIFFQPKVGDIVVIKVSDREMVKRIQNYHGRDIYVIGDNEKESTDSRNFGPINKSDVIGKVVFVR